MIYSKMIDIAPPDLKSSTNSSQTSPPQVILKKEKSKEQVDEYGINLDDILSKRELREQSRKNVHKQKK